MSTDPRAGARARARLSARVMSEVRKFLLERKRYLAATVASTTTLMVVFLAAFLGFRGLAGEAAGAQTLEVLIVSYLLWVFALSGLQTFANEVAEEMQRGTLEQLYLSPYGLWSVLLVRAALLFVFSIVLVSVLLLLIMLATGIWLAFSPLPVLAVMLLGVPSLWGRDRTEKDPHQSVACSRSSTSA